MERVVGDIAGKEGSVEGVLTLYAKLLWVAKTALPDAAFVKALHDGMAPVLNGTHAPRVLEGLCKHCDHLLRPQCRLSEAEVDRALDQVLRLFVHISNKDMFYEVYLECMSRRLLAQCHAFHPPSTDTERCFLSKLKHQCGDLSTGKLEKMVIDLDESAQKNKDIQQSPQWQRLGVDFSVQVLTRGVWPLTPGPKWHPPPVMGRCISFFENAYATWHRNRKLTWVHQESTAIVVANVGPSPVELHVGALQCAVLLLFSTQNALRLGQVAAKLSLSPKECADVVLVLTNNKIPILEAKFPGPRRESPRKRQRVDEDASPPALPLDTTLSVSAALVRGVGARRVMMLERKATKLQAKAKAAVEVDRKLAVEAAIVRVMKHHQHLTFARLQGEVLAAVRHRFEPDPKLVKQRVEALIDLDFISRDKDDATLLHYSA